MELILWRHAEAEPGEPDLERQLTAKGIKQAARMGEWLDQTLPNTCRILVSPAVRTVQTADALGRKYRIVPELAPDRGIQELLVTANWPESRESVLVVGHQPTLGRVASLLIAGQAQPWAIRKASICWIAQKEQRTANILRAVMSPDLIFK